MLFDSRIVAADIESPLYRDLMRFRPEALTPNAWAIQAGVSRTVWADMRRHDNPSRKTLEKLLKAANSSLAEFEALRVGKATATPDSRGGAAGVGDARAAGWRGADLPLLPLRATSTGGEWGNPGAGIERIAINPLQQVGEIERPDSLAADKEAYALTILGDAMWPRFRPGRRLIVSPRAPVAIGDDVLVSLSATGAPETAPVLALIKELVRRSAGFIELRQFNPDVVFRVENSAIRAIHKIVGESI